MATKTATPDLDDDRLLEVVRGRMRPDDMSPLRAMVELRRRGPEAEGALLSVATDARGTPRFRHLATMGLYELGGERAEAGLARAAAAADRFTAPTVAMALGRVGGRDRLELVEEMGRIADDVGRERAAFGATLLAYRHGLGGHDVRAPRGNQLMDEPEGRGGRAIELAKARAATVRHAMEAAEREPVGVELTNTGATTLECEPNTFTWLWTVDGAERTASGERGVAGLLFRQHRFDKGQSLSAIGLVSSTRGGGQLTIHRADTGTVLYSAKLSGGELSLRAAKVPGHAAVAIEASLGRGGAVQVERAVSGTVVREARTPSRA